MSEKDMTQDAPETETPQSEVEASEVESTPATGEGETEGSEPIGE